MKKSMIIACLLLASYCIPGVFQVYQELKLVSEQHQAFLITEQGAKFLELKKNCLSLPLGTVAVDRDGRITILNNPRYFEKYPSTEKISRAIFIGETKYYPPTLNEQEEAERKYLYKLARDGEFAPRDWQETLK